MSLGYLSPCCRLTLVSLLALLAGGLGCDLAHARASRHHAAQNAKHEARHHVVHGSDYRPPYAAIVLDANSGQVLHEANADEPRHPASVTKIMTLYLLFEQIEAGKFKLDTPLQISAQAAMQPPTKLGLKPNGTITVDDAIKGLCTRSANDGAVVVSEAVGGSEGEFARLMTLKARELGMSNTTYVNASGLPAEEQVTTARDQAILGRAIQIRFPEFYRYFSTLNFRYRGADIHNHNSLLGQVQGVDGIKTGYTEASGYNLVASVRRNARHIVAVVLGGASGATRDARMRQLIEQYIPQATAQRAAPVVQTAGHPIEKADSPALVPAPIAVPTEAVAPATARVKPDQPDAASPQPSVAKSEPAASISSPGAAPNEGIAPTLASVKADQAEAAKPQPPAAKSKGHGRRPVAKATTPVSAIAHPPRGSW
jgi:D-alanyl-D-alanine carboxypeptidase